MEPLFKVYLLTLGMILVLPTGLSAGQALEVDKGVQDGLIAAQPAGEQGVDHQLFNGKPVLMVFFSSWWTTCELLNEGWKSKAGIVAVNWNEGRYSCESEAWLQQIVGEFHPDIRVILETPWVNGDFAPLVYVPAEFLFDNNWKQIFSDCSQEYLSEERLIALLEKAS